MKCIFFNDIWKILFNILNKIKKKLYLVEFIFKLIDELDNNLINLLNKELQNQLDLFFYFELNNGLHNELYRELGVNLNFELRKGLTNYYITK